MFLEKQIKDDFNTFYPVKFENEKAEDGPEHFEDDYERIEQKKKYLIVFGFSLQQEMPVVH